LLLAEKEDDDLQQQKQQQQHRIHVVVTNTCINATPPNIKVNELNNLAAFHIPSTKNSSFSSAPEGYA